MKAANPQEKKCQKSSTKEKKCSKKEINLQSKPPMWNLDMKEMSLLKKSTLKTKESDINLILKKNIGKEPLVGNKNLAFPLNQKKRIKHPSEVHDSKQKERFYFEEKTNSQTKNSGLDLNQMDSYADREEAMQNRAPVFDLNLKLDEEDDLQGTLRCEEPKSILSVETKSLVI